MQHRIKRIHLIGIGGVGMSGIAEVLHNLGYIVSGSDAAAGSTTERLHKLGILVFIGHKAENIGNNIDVIVSSTAIDQNNPELVIGHQRGITIIPRAMMLAELMRFKHGIAIAGTHGKTTTTSLCAEVLRYCDLDPTFVIGGKLASTDSNAKLGSGEYMVVEADESDASFLYLHPLIAVVTNIDLDHMDTYQQDESKLNAAFLSFLHNLPFYGTAILCAEDERITKLIPDIKRRIVSYGLHDKCKIYAKDIKPCGTQMQFTVCLNFEQHHGVYRVKLNLSGIHNVLNSLAAIAVGLECQGKISDILAALESFHGVGRRCQKYQIDNLAGKKVLVIDDYGHHPTELKATIAGLQEAYPDMRMILVFQPHRYTRTRDLFADFVQVLSTVKHAVILEVYPAGEQPIANFDGNALVHALELNGVKEVLFAKDLRAAKEILSNIANDGDLIVNMGAGDIAKLPTMLDEK